MLAIFHGFASRSSHARALIFMLEFKQNPAPGASRLTVADASSSFSSPFSYSERGSKKLSTTTLPQA